MKLDVKKSAISRPALEPIKKDNNFLFGGCTPCYLSSVEFMTQKHEKGEFKGMEVPGIKFEFTSYKLSKNDVDRFHTHTEKIVGCKQLDEASGELVAMNSDTVNVLIEQSFMRIKAMFQGFVGTANYREIENITPQENDNFFDLPSEGEPAARIAKFTAYFKFLVDFFNRGGKSMNTDKDGKLIPIFLRLEPDYKTNRFYTVPTYPEKGLIEVMRFDNNKQPIDPQILRIKVPMELKKGGTKPGKGGATPGSPVSGGDDVDDLINRSHE